MSQSETTRSGRSEMSETELIVLMASLMALQALGIDSMLPALGHIGDDLGLLGNDRQFVISSYFLGAGIGAFFPGAFADRFGRRPVIFLGIVSYIVLSLACAMATHYWTLIGIRVAQGALCAGLSVVPTAIVRDKVGGDRMAKMMSLIIMIFMAVPIFAPALGQLVLVFAGWREIFLVMALLALGVGIWTWARLPESLTEENVQRINPKTVLRNMGRSLSNRVSFGYVVGSALVFGSLFGFLNSSQQLISETFGAGDYFALIFGGSVVGMAVASFTNSRIVERFGARRVSHTALIGFLLVNLVQLYFAGPDQKLWEFVPLLSLSMTLLGFVGSNFGSIAMQPFQEIAGAASSAHMSLRMITGAVLGAAIGRAYDGTAMPLAIAMLTCSIISIALVLFSERGKLFRRPGEARRYMLFYDIMRH